MAKYTVEHTCGHDQVYNLFGPHKERDRKLDWLATTVCTTCWQAEQAAERERANAEAARANQAAGLPELVGSPKQVAWAESIRAPIAQALREAAEEIKGHLKPDLDEERRRIITEGIDRIVAELLAETSAGQWIDQRSALASLGEARHAAARIKQTMMRDEAIITALKAASGQ